MISELKSIVDSFSSQLAEIFTENTAMISDICILQDRLSSLESFAKNEYQFPELINKIWEPDNCLCKDLT